jgi:plastocyanin
MSQSPRSRLLVIIRFLSASLCCACLWLWANTHNLHAGDITGAISITPAQPQAMKPIRGVYRGPAQPSAQKHAIPPAKAIVYIDGLAAPANTNTPNHYVINQEGLQFIPNLLPVLVGDIVQFPNNDDVYHNAFSYSKPNSFDLGRYPKGKSKSAILKHPGVVQVFCEIHSHMRAVILVLENPWFTVAENDKPFTIPNVPAGDWQLKIWFSRQDIQTLPVTVPQEGTVTVNFSR